MPNEQLVVYIQENLKHGYTAEQIRQAMLKEGYSPSEINGLFNYINSLSATEPLPEPRPAIGPEERPIEEQHLSGFAFGVLVAGLVAISFVLTIPLLFYSGFGKGGPLATYLIILASALVAGYITFKVLSTLVKRDFLIVISGALTPVISLISMVGVFYLTKKVSELSIRHAAALRATSPIASVLGVPHSPFLTSIFFYIVFNVFILLYIIKKKETKALLWYLLAIPVYLLAWLISVPIVNALILRALA